MRHISYLPYCCERHKVTISAGKREWDIKGLDRGFVSLETENLSDEEGLDDEQYITFNTAEAFEDALNGLLAAGREAYPELDL